MVLKENTIQASNLHIHTVRIPTNKRANSYELKQSKIGNTVSIKSYKEKRLTHIFVCR